MTRLLEAGMSGAGAAGQLNEKKPSRSRLWVCGIDENSIPGLQPLLRCNAPFVAAQESMVVFPPRKLPASQ